MGLKLYLVHFRIKGIEIVWISDGSGVYSQPPAQASAGIGVQSTFVVLMDERYVPFSLVLYLSKSPTIHSTEYWIIVCLIREGLCCKCSV